MIQPFASGFYDGDRYVSFWGENCVERMVTFLASIDETLLIYIHNGGRFDLFYFLKHIQQREMRIINNRIVQCWIGKHEVRDSYAIIPMSLEAANQKTKIDYGKFTEDRRDRHRQEILDYLGDDCKYLYTLVKLFYEEFGDNLTIGGTALKQLKSFHKFATGDRAYDETLRKQYYYGGRVQCFGAGVEPGPWKVYDVNSMYPKAMRDYLHPVGNDVDVLDEITDETCFLAVRGMSHGAFPQRNKKGSLDFPHAEGLYFVSIHEYRVAIANGAFELVDIAETLNWKQRSTFDEFVDHYYNARLAAKAAKDKIHDTFYKLILNSSYGKFAQNPDNYKDWYLTSVTGKPPDWHECDENCDYECKYRWTPSFIFADDYIIWERPISMHNFYNIATGASITGAARSILLDGLHKAIEPIYCDTDSIICRDLPGVAIGETELGAWKLECEAEECAIAGKKLYALYNPSKEDHVCTDACDKVCKVYCPKKAHKGGRLTAQQVKAIAEGSTVTSYNMAPTFKWDGSHSFIKRNLKRTV